MVYRVLKKSIDTQYSVWYNIIDRLSLFVKSINGGVIWRFKGLGMDSQQDHVISKVTTYPGHKRPSDNYK